MALVSVVNAEELRQVAIDTYVNESFDVALVNSPGTLFGATDTFSTIISNEVTVGLGGYSRKTFTYSSTDVGTYQSGLRAIPLARKSVTWTHDDSQQVVEWTHVVLIRRSTSSIVSVTQLTNAVQLVEDQQAIYYFDLLFYGTTGSA